jgi:hypothetical protein
VRQLALRLLDFFPREAFDLKEEDFRRECVVFGFDEEFPAGAVLAQANPPASKMLATPSMVFNQQSLRRKTHLKARTPEATRIGDIFNS